VRGDKIGATSATWRAAKRKIPDLFKLRLTKNVRRADEEDGKGCGWWIGQGMEGHDEATTWKDGAAHVAVISATLQQIGRTKLISDAPARCNKIILG